jgi:hypothetical protein
VRNRDTGETMGDVIDFPIRVKSRVAASQTTWDHDPYYRFIREVLLTADACGFSLPVSIESAIQTVYLKTRNTSQLARLLTQQRS